MFLLDSSSSSVTKQSLKRPVHIGNITMFYNNYRVLASYVAQLGKNPPATQEILVRFLGQEVPLEKG